MPDFKDKNLIDCLVKGGVALMPTDTIYGVLGKAENKETVERIYKLKGRKPEKPCIILIGEINDLRKFSVSLTGIQMKKLEELWKLPNIFSKSKRPTSVILECKDSSLEYLHRETKSLAFRLPFSIPLRELLIKTGPLIAPSANPEGLPPAQNIEQAKKYFSDSADFYLDGGEIIGVPSRLIGLNEDGSIDILRD